MDKEKNIARDTMVVSSGGAAMMGLTTVALGIGAGVFSLSIAPIVGAIAGLGGFIVGAVGSYWYEDEILKEVEKLTRRFENLPPPTFP